MRPRLQSSAYARPLNFTVSSHLTGLDMPTRLWCFSLVLALHSVISAGAGSLPNLHPKPLAMPEGVGRTTARHIDGNGGDAEARTPDWSLPATVSD